MRGRGGATLADAWRGSPRAYLGTTVAGFPNYFTLVGPNSAGGFNSIVFTVEAHINYVIEAIRAIERGALHSVEVRRDVYDFWARDVEHRLRNSVWNAGGCTSWYLDERGNNNVWWPGFTWRLWQRTRRFDVGSYLTQPARPAPGQPADPSREPSLVRVISRLAVGGPAVQAITLTSALEARGYRTTLIRGREEPDEGSLDEWRGGFGAAGAGERLRRNFGPTTCSRCRP